MAAYSCQLVAAGERKPTSAELQDQDTSTARAAKPSILLLSGSSSALVAVSDPLWRLGSRA